MTHLLVTNDYPPKVGGIQNYLWELYRRLPAEEFAILTTPYAGTEQFDRDAGYHIERFRRFWLSPTPDVRRHIETMVKEIGASLVLFDPAVPVGHLGPSLSVPYGVFLHGAEVTVPARIPGARSAFARTLNRSSLVVSASNYALGEAERLVGRPLNSVYVPPGVDVDRFVPLTPLQRREVRIRHGLDPSAPLLVSVSRLVPRKGMDRLIEASTVLAREFLKLQTLIIGTGREEDRLQKLIDKNRAPVKLLGRVADEDIAPLVGAADVFSMLCGVRWGGLEQEGFGIVFLEAAAAGVAQVAGDSGGAGEAVADGLTGHIVDPRNLDEVVTSLRQLLTSPDDRVRMGVAARQRAVAEFSYDLLAERLFEAITRQAEQS